MLVIKIELWPRGYEENKVELHRAKLWNDATGTKSIGNYKAEFYGKDGRLYKKSELKGFKRLTTGAWKLLYLMLKNCFEKENVL